MAIELLRDRYTVTLLRGRSVQCADFRGASAAVRADIGHLGASKWYGRGAGRILNPEGVQVAFVSYNGRVWLGQAEDGAAKHVECDVGFAAHV